MPVKVYAKKCVWDRLKQYYKGVRVKYPNTWKSADTQRQIQRIRSILSVFPAISVWSREPVILKWREAGYQETWQRGYPWHFAFTYEVNGKVEKYTIWEVEHEDNITEEDTEI